MLPSPAVPGFCLVPFRFLCDIHSIHSVLLSGSVSPFDDLLLCEHCGLMRIAWKDEWMNFRFAPHRCWMNWLAASLQGLILMHCNAITSPKMWGLSYKKRRFKRPKVWDVWNVNSEFGTFHIVACIPYSYNDQNFGTFETYFLIGEWSAWRWWESSRGRGSCRSASKT